MASITSTGVGSGLDVNSLVSQLVAAERKTADARLGAADKKATTEFSAVAKLKSALSTFQSSVQTLTTRAAFEPRSVSVGNDKLLKVSADATAVAGHYDVEVVQLAKAAQLGSAAFVGGDSSVVGTGTLTLSLGAQSFDVTVDGTNNTLANIRDAINSANTNPGVRATIIRDTQGSRLVLTSATTGVANVVTVSTADGDSGLQRLTSAQLTTIAPAQDAIVKIAGYEVHSTSNTVANAIDGVTLSLTAAEPGEVVAVDVTRDDTAMKGKIETFVGAFNALANQVKVLGAYDAATETAGPLLGDAMLRGIDAQLRRMLSDPVAGVPGNPTLSSLGISTTADGTLKLDGDKLTKALAADPGALTKVFSSENGVATRLNTYLTARLSTTGEIASRNTSISERLKDVTKQQKALEARMEVIQARYMKQFSALDSLLTNLQSTSTYLTQQFDGLSKLSKG
jgi:flagellar hook-associated protein 2